MPDVSRANVSRMNVSRVDISRMDISRIDFRWTGSLTEARPPLSGVSSGSRTGNTARAESMICCDPKS